MSTTTQKTYTPKASEVTHAWRLVDAQDQTLGRLATQIACWLRGKHLPTFSEHMDLGDFVVVVNAGGIRLTGNKAQQRFYYRHSTYPGGLKAVAVGEVLEKHPERVIKHTVRGMLPHNALGRKILRKLKIYAGPEHPHSAQFRAWEKQQQRGTSEAPQSPSAAKPPVASETTS
jgi:large subunit ribosomal protein L13